ncbi:hypothetical protein KXX06_006519, partial [Aspergillus fumigatus]
KNRWIAQALYKAFVQAQQLTYEQLRVSASLKTMLPWQIAAVEETIATLGDQWWPYGIEKNRHVLETFTRYHHEQGLSPRQLTIEDMFAPETVVVDAPSLPGCRRIPGERPLTGCALSVLGGGHVDARRNLGRIDPGDGDA